MRDKEERPPKPTLAGAEHPPPNSLSAVLLAVVVSREYGLPKVPRPASIPVNMLERNFLKVSSPNLMTRS